MLGVSKKNLQDRVKTFVKLTAADRQSEYDRSLRKDQEVFWFFFYIYISVKAFLGKLINITTKSIGFCN